MYTPNKKINSKLLLLVISFMVITDTDRVLSFTTPKLGTNVNFISDWTSEIMLKDVGRRIRQFSCGSVACSTDKNGWPLLKKDQIAKTTIFTKGDDFMSMKYPKGTYHVFYDGTGSISYSGATLLPNSIKGHDIISVTDNSLGLGYSITSSNNNPNNIRNIRVIIPGGDCGDIFVPADSEKDCVNGKKFRPNYETYTTEPFYSNFLSLYKPYSAVRFLNVMLPDQGIQGKTMRTDPLTFSSRVKMTDAIWLKRGMPVEIMVKLANTLNVDPWFTIPHLANDLILSNQKDPYVKQFAEYVHTNLNPNLKAYIEYSNEVWNPIFESNRYAFQKGQELKLSPSTNKNLGALRYQSEQSVKMFHIWNDVYGGKSNRIVRVISAQALPSPAPNQEPYASKNLLDWKDAYKETDALAIAPYFNVLPSDESKVADYTLSQLFNYINNTLIPKNKEAILANANVVKKRGINLVAYEGGQHLVERGDFQKNKKLNKLYNDANQDKRMGEVYSILLNIWKENTDGIFMHFLTISQQNTGAVGRFGALESMYQDPRTSPKYTALLDYQKTISKK